MNSVVFEFPMDLPTWQVQKICDLFGMDEPPDGIVLRDRDGDAEARGLQKACIPFNRRWDDSRLRGAGAEVFDGLSRYYAVGWDGHVGGFTVSVDKHGAVDRKELDTIANYIKLCDELGFSLP